MPDKQKYTLDKQTYVHCFYKAGVVKKKIQLLAISEVYKQIKSTIRQNTNKCIFFYKDTYIVLQSTWHYFVKISCLYVLPVHNDINIQGSNSQNMNLRYRLKQPKSHIII